MEESDFRKLAESPLTDVLKRAQLEGYVGKGDILNHLKSSALFFECILRQSLTLSNLDIVDIGSGGGLPGLVIALLLEDYPRASITLVEASKKRADFLEDAATYLKLNDRIKVFWGSAATYKKRNQNVTHNLGTARLFAGLPVTLEYLAPILSVSSKLIISAHSLDSIKTDNRFIEACNLLGIQYVSKEELDDHWFWIFQKVQNNDSRFPRDKEAIKLSPLFEANRDCE